MTKVPEMLQVPEESFLLERGEAAHALLIAADKRLVSRHKAERPRQNLVNELARMTTKK